MPENGRVAVYAAAGSIIAATLAYVFSPSFWPDVGAAATRKRGIVGIRNPGNDCFINSVLQALASSEVLRDFLQAEIEARADGGIPHDVATLQSAISVREGSKEVGLKGGLVTSALSEILGVLNEKHTFQKNISNFAFIRSLELAFATRISKRQQDAQEFLQIVAERVLDEHEALIKFLKARRVVATADVEKLAPPEPLASKRARSSGPGPESEGDELSSSNVTSASSLESLTEGDQSSSSTADRIPFLGKLESQVECQTCHFQPKPSVSTFVCLTLNVPQRKVTTMDDCLDVLFKQETIDDYVCDRCRLEHALALTEKVLDSVRKPDDRELLESRRALIRKTMEEDPEKIPADLPMPDLKQAPRRKITKFTHLSHYPKVLAVHLSRSIFDPGSYSMKNLASVAFSEHLRLGGFNRQDYKLSCLITHIGGHNSGHYETFRRQADHVTAAAAAAAAQPPFVSPDAEVGKLSKTEQAPQPETQAATKKKLKVNKRWWRISDDRIGSCSLNDVLSMKREAYILIYEREDSPSDGGMLGG